MPFSRFSDPQASIHHFAAPASRLNTFLKLKIRFWRFLAHFQPHFRQSGMGLCSWFQVKIRSFFTFSPKVPQIIPKSCGNSLGLFFAFFDHFGGFSDSGYSAKCTETAIFGHLVRPISRDLAGFRLFDQKCPKSPQNHVETVWDCFWAFLGCFGGFSDFGYSAKCTVTAIFSHLVGPISRDLGGF